MLKTILGLIAVIVIAILSSMLLDESTMSYFRNDHVSIIDEKNLFGLNDKGNGNLVSNTNSIDFLLNSQVSDDVPLHF
jgi:hypothetical protein